MGAGQALQLGQDVPERLGVHPVAPAPAVDQAKRRGCRAVQRCLGQDGVEDGVNAGPKLAASTMPPALITGPAVLAAWYTRT